MPQRSRASLRLSHRSTDHAAPRRSRAVARGAVALALTAPVVVAGVAAATAPDSARDALAAVSASASPGEGIESLAFAEREERASRGVARIMRTVTLDPRPVDHLYATAPLNVWTGPGEDTRRVGLVKWGTKLAVTGQRVDGWAEVLLGDKRVDRWVNARYLAEKKPKPERDGVSASGTGLSGAPCPDGSSIEAGLTSSADRVYRAVCNAFPALTTYGGLDPHGEHVDGRAIDFMVTDKALGDAIAQYLLANASALNLRDIIWYQQIWTPERAAEGWRYMGDRGSPTANHIDHVHVAVY